MIPSKAWVLVTLAALSLVACQPSSSSGKPLSAGLSTIVLAPSTQFADGVQVATITVTARLAGNAPAGGVTVELDATGSNNIVSPASALTDAAGTATFTLASTKAEVKTVSATLRRKGKVVILRGAPNVTFVGDPSAVSSALSSVLVTPAAGVLANGVESALITVLVRDVNGNIVAGQTVQPAATGSNQTVTPATALSDALGLATFSLTTTLAESKTVTATVNPGPGAVTLDDAPTTLFIADASTIDAALSSVVAAPNIDVVADGVETSTATIVVRDAFSNPVPGQAVTLAATGTVNTIAPAWAVTDAAGTATLDLSSTAAELKTLTATVNAGPGQVVLATTPAVQFIGDASTISSTLSSASAVPTSGVIADDLDSSTITVVVLDVNSNPVPTQAVVLAASGASNTFAPALATTDAAGTAVVTLVSTKAESKTVTTTINPGAGQVVLVAQPSVGFSADASTIDSTLSTAVAVPALGVVADGIQTSAITVTVLDANSNPVAGQAVTLVSSGTNNTFTPVVTSTNASGVASFTQTSSTAELKTLTATVNPGPGQVVLLTQPTVEFVANSLNLSALLSTAGAAPVLGVVADGTDSSTVSVVVLDGNGNPVAGQSVSLTSDGSGNSIAPGLATTSAGGVATFALESTTAELKTLTATVNPGAGQIVLVAQPTVEFIGDASTINAGLSSASATPTSDVVADGVTVSTVSIVVRDVNGNAVAAQGVALAATGTGNTLAPALATTDAAGLATLTISSTKAELKTLTATINPGAGQVVVTTQPTVDFIGDAAAISSTLSTLTALPATGVVADGVTASTITATLLDVNSNPVAGQGLVVAATGSLNTIAPAFALTDASGVATLTIASTRAELKQLTATSNPGPGQVTLTTQPTVTFIADASSISAGLSSAGAAPVSGMQADGVEASTLTVVVRDANGNLVAGQSVALAATGTGNVVAPALATTDAAGSATLTLASTTAEAKTTTLTVNPGGGQVVLLAQPTMVFDPLPNINAGLSSATVTPTFGPLADGSDTATVSVTLRDDGGLPVPGVTVQFVSSGAPDAWVVRGQTDGAGFTSATLTTTTAELKRLTITGNPGLGAVVLDDIPEVEFVWPSASTYYVRATGSDGAAGTSPATAFATLGPAALSVVAGDTVFVGAGTFPPATLSLGGASGSPVRFRADTSGVHTGDAGQVTIDAAGANDALLIDGADHVWIEGFTLTGSTSAGGPSGGVRITGSDALVRDNHIHGNDNGVFIAGVHTWWDSSYGQRRELAFGTDHALLPLGFTAALTLDTRVSNTNIAQPSGGDLRVVWHPIGGAPVELDRQGDAFNAAATVLEFRLQSELGANANQDPDGAYFLYYENPGAGSPPADISGIYFFGDAFDRADSSTIGNGWSEWSLGGDPAIVGNELSMQALGNLPPAQLGVKQDFPLGAIPGDFTVSFDWDLPSNSENTWVCWGLNIGDAAALVDTDRTAGVGPGLYGGEDLGLTGVEAIDNDMSGALENNINGLHSYLLDVQRAGSTYDYHRGGALRSAGVAWVSTPAVLDQIRLGGDNAVLGVGEEWTWDNLRIALVVSNDPELAAGSEETPLDLGARNVLIESNWISNNSGGTGHGLVCSAATDAILRNNLIYNNAGSGLLVSDACSNLLVELCTLYSNSGDQVHVDAAGNSVVVRDCTAVLGLADGIELEAGSTTQSSYNTVWGQVGTDWLGLSAGTGDLNLDPQFVDPDGPDNLLGGAEDADDSFHLDPGFPSPALDAGSLLAVNQSFASGHSGADTTTRADGLLDGEAPDAGTLNMGYHYDPTTTVLSELVAGDARLFHGEGALRQPRTRTWSNGSGWSAEGAGLSAASTVLWTSNAVSPLANKEELCAVLSLEGASTELDLLRWDGAAWSVDWTATDIAGTHATKRGVALRYEQLSGDALVVYSDNTATPVYRTRSGGVWSTEAALPLNDAGGPDPDPNTGTVLWCLLASRPGSDEVALLYADLNDDLVAITWDGDLWTTTSAVLLETALVANSVSGDVENRPLDLAYESLSGDLLTAWGQDGTAGVRYALKPSGTDTWSAPASVLAPLVGQTHHVDLCRDPSSDRIGLVSMDLAGTERLGLATWTGAAWQDAGEYDSQTRNVNDLAQGDLPAAVAWVGASGVAVCVYADEATAALEWATWSSGAGWIVQGSFAVVGKGFTESVLLAGSEGPDRLLAVFSDDSDALYAATFDGASWTLENGGAPLEATLSANASAPFSLSVR